MPSFFRNPLVRTSRPRFWIYLLGPFLLGAVSGASWLTLLPTAHIALLVGWLVWLTLPANLFLYGVNDLFDEETDALNDKKTSYETRLSPTDRARLVRSIHASLALAVFLAALQSLFAPSLLVVLGVSGFVLLGWQYSAPPLRAKARPWLDSASNVLYLFPALIGAGAVGLRLEELSWMVLLAGTLWCMSMHAFSAVPDIHADAQAGLRTIATTLGKQRTIILCGALYLAAALLVVPVLGWIALGYGGLYLLLMIDAWRAKNAEELLRVYRAFPWVNTLVGFLLFWTVLWRQLSPFLL